MVDLPHVANGVPQVTAPQSRVSPGQVASPYVQLSESLDLASRELGDFSKRQAKEAGLTAVTRDAEGNVQVERPFIVGDAAIEYQNSVKVAAVTDGENVIKTDMLKMRHEFENDPVGFAKAAQSYSKEKVGQYQKAAGPAVGLALGRIAQDTAREFHEGLLNQKERRDVATAKVSIETQIESTKNEIFAIAAGGDTTSPEYTRRLEKIGALWGQLSGNPKFGVPQAQIVYEMKQLKSELDVAALGHSLERVQKEKGTAAAMQEADRIRTDPSLALTPAQRFTYYSRLVTGINARERAENVITKQTEGEISEVGTRAAEGLPVPPGRMAALRQQVAESKNPELARKLQDVETVLPTIASWQKMNPAQLEGTLSDLNRQMREHGAPEVGITLRDTGQKLLKQMREGVEKDPLAWSDRTGTLPIPAIDFASPDVSTALRDRGARADAVAAHYGIPASYLTPDERTLLTKVSSVGGQPMLDVAKTLVDGFGERAPRVLSEVSKDAPVLAHLGGLMTSGGSPALMRDAAEAVRLRQDKEFKLPHWLDKPSDKILRAQHDLTIQEYGSAFFLAPDTGRAAEMTAQAAFFARSARNGYDPLFADGDTGAGKKAYNRALQESAGATFDPKGTQYGGIASFGTRPGTWFSGNKVLIPGNIRTDRFGDVLGALKAEDVVGAQGADGKKFTARDLQNAVPVAVRGGYRFAVGDPMSDSPKWIRGADGNAFVLDLDRLEPALRKRVPGAYAGGQ